MGSGTTLYECERLKRNFIGFDINEEILSHVSSRMQNSEDIKFFINNCDVTNYNNYENVIQKDLKELGKQRYDFVLFHPPYWDIIKFTDNPSDLSNCPKLEDFISKFILVVAKSVQYLYANHYFALVIGDIYRNSEVIPLGFLLMSAIRSNVHCKLKGIVIKDIIGNQGKIGQEALWRYRALKNGTFLFKHEYIFVFKKQK
jgi:hypothetical protein